MKILATGDWHIGAGLDYGATPAARLGDQEAVIDRIVDLAIEHDVDVLAIAGDVWHRRRPTPAELMAVARPLRRLRASHGCDIVAIAGNHCVEHADSPVALELFEDILDVYRRPAVAQTRAGAIAMLPWTPTSRLVAEAGTGDRDRLNESAADLLIAAARDLRSQVTGSAVLMLHWSISGASTPTGVKTDEFREVVLPLDELEALGFDAIVAGHIHKPQRLETHLAIGTAAPIFYVGSPAPVDFGEGASGHGCWLLELDGDGFQALWSPIASRPFVTIDCDLTTGAHEALGLDETDAVAAAIATHLPLDDAVVRLRYRASEEQARRIDWPKLRPLLDRAHKVFSISAEITRSDRARVQVDEDLAPLDALGMYIAANDLNGSSDALVDLTTRYLEVTES